jgi:hypothetical protein
MSSATKPVAKIGFPVTAAIWRNEKNGRASYSATFQLSYKDDSDNWKRTARSPLRISSHWRRSSIWHTQKCANSATRIVRQFKSRDQSLTTSYHHLLPGFRLRQELLALHTRAHCAFIPVSPTARAMRADSAPVSSPALPQPHRISAYSKMRGTIADALILRFSHRRMLQANKTDSKLCASMTRHATARRPAVVVDGSTCKGGFAPRCIPRQRSQEAWSYA